jgi:HK97 gp10 family phage protein
MTNQRTTRIKDAREIERVLKQLPDKLSEQAFVNALRAGARIIVRDAQHRVPVFSGALRDAITVRKATKKMQRRGAGNVVIGFKKPESRRAHLTEFGTSSQPAQPFMRPAIDSKGAAAIDAIGEKLGREVESKAEKLAGSYAKSGLARRRR